MANKRGENSNLMGLYMRNESSQLNYSSKAIDKVKICTINNWRAPDAISIWPLATPTPQHTQLHCVASPSFS